MGRVSEQIEAILAARHERLGAVDAEIRAWTDAQTGLLRLGKAIEAPLESGETGPLSRPTGSAGDQAAVLDHLRSAVSTALEDLHAARSRFSRRTVNIGVSGKARVGKSTLLQSISGLTDEQIPTGPDIPVTAVRSRIMQSDRQCVILHMHSAESFLSEVIAPYHRLLGIEGVPETLQQFRDWAYPKPDPKDPERHSSNAHLVTVQGMQASFDSYAALLTGGEVEQGLEGLRPYVAHPTSEELAAGTVHRPYLAVREAAIETPFPNADAARLLVVDLPGLGDLAAGAEERHVQDLRHHVDAVLLVLRPSSTSAFYTKADDNTLKLLDHARGHVHTPRHYVHLVINSGGETPGGIEALRNHLRVHVNDSTDGAYFHVLETDAADPEMVRESLLVPFLETLAQTLPTMDDEVFSGVMTQVADTAQHIEEALPQLVGDPAAARELTHLKEELLQRRASELRWKVDRGLRTIVDELWRAAHRDGVDERYTDAVEAAFHEVLAWAEDGFGLGSERWQEEARLRMPADRAASPFLVDEMHRVRVEVSRRFRALDAFFRDQLDATWRDIAEAFREACGPLLRGDTGEQALRELEVRLRESSCPVLADAVRDLLQTRLDYRTHLHPRVREELDGFSLEIIDPDTGRPKVVLLAPADEAGAELLEQRLLERTQKAAFETMVALQREAVLPALVLYAAVKQFEDELILSADSRQEFLRLARGHRDLLWHDDFRRLDAADARARDLAALAGTVHEALARHARHGEGNGGA
ncbi:hypothetical protein [Streptomyces sp. NPDC020607]|uniref:hypothetical protein n=1 Tax=Streptomyces sp. NPDC020607 TaxID=3365082 RepID=UPI0037957363